jgi:hypothetical protein
MQPDTKYAKSGDVRVAYQVTGASAFAFGSQLPEANLQGSAALLWGGHR